MECCQYQYWSSRATVLRVSTTHGCASACLREDMLCAKRWSPWSIARARRVAEAVLPPILVRGWMGEDQVSKKGWAKLGDGLVAPEVTGEGAINPWQLYLVAPVGGCEQPANGVHSPPHAHKWHKVVRGMQWHRRPKWPGRGCHPPIQAG